jgi:hypothetical protein
MARRSVETVCSHPMRNGSRGMRIVYQPAQTAGSHLARLPRDRARESRQETSACP